MSLAARATLLILAVSVCAAAQTRTLAVYAGPANGLDTESGSALQWELQRLLAPAGLELLWKASVDRKSGDDFDFVVVGSFRGSCSVVEVPPPPSGALEPASLAETSVADGRILPFLDVDCGRVLQMLRPQLDPLDLRSRQAAFGRALGRVIAHKIYHIVAQTAEHHDTGVTKAALSTRDLTTPRLEFDAWSVARMRPPSVVPSSTAEGVAAGRYSVRPANDWFLK